jgi:hypothetical protein
MTAHLVTAGFLVASALSIPAATLTLRATALHTVPIFSGDAWTTNSVRNSRILQLGSNQVAKVRHFYCASTYTNDFQVPSTVIALRVEYDDLVTFYTHQTLFGGVQTISLQQENLTQTQTQLTGVAPAGSLPELAGPATLQLVFRGPVDGWNGPIFGNPETRTASICTIEVDGLPHVFDPDEVLRLDADSIIIPEKEGPVEVILESSIDLKQTWQPALPGVYAPIDQKRFFRLKAARQ